MATTYTVSPTNFQIVSPQVADHLQIIVGQPGVYSSGITLKPQNGLNNAIALFVQMGLTLPTGKLTNVSFNYAAHPAAGSQAGSALRFITQTIQAGSSSPLWSDGTNLTGSGTSSHDASLSFAGSLDFILQVYFNNMNDSFQVGQISFTVE